LDEPTAFLDWENRELVIKLLVDLAIQTNKIIIFSTHERDLAIRYASHVWQLSPRGIEIDL
ncbi:MAG: ABC transporter ATP-binding protein, partial [Mucinivorans sp.]